MPLVVVGDIATGLGDIEFLHKSCVVVGIVTVGRSKIVTVAVVIQLLLFL